MGSPGRHLRGTPFSKTTCDLSISLPVAEAVRRALFDMMGEIPVEGKICLLQLDIAHCLQRLLVL